MTSARQSPVSPARAKAVAEAKQVPDLTNATPTFLLDEIGRIRVEASRLKFMEGVYKDALRGRITNAQLHGEEPIVGEKYVGYYEDISQVRIDSDAVRGYFANDPETLQKLSKTISYPQLNVKPKESQPHANPQTKSSKAKS